MSTDNGVSKDNTTILVRIQEQQKMSAEALKQVTDKVDKLAEELRALAIDVQVMKTQVAPIWSGGGKVVNMIISIVSAILIALFTTYVINR